MTAGCNHDALGAELVLGHTDVVRRAQTAMPPQQRDAPPGKILFVDAVQARDVGLAPAAQRPPVMAIYTHIEAVAGGILQALGELRGNPHDLFRNATDVDTGAPEPAGFDDHYAGAVLRGALRAREATAPATDDRQIVVITHDVPPGCSSPRLVMLHRPAGARMTPPFS